MSWLFSRALVAEFSAATCWDGGPSAPLNVMPTPHKFWRHDKMMDVSRLSLFGLTCAVLTEDHGAALLTWFQEGFPAKTSVRQEQAPVSWGGGLGSGAKWRELSVRYDPASSSWRTHLCLWDEVLPWSSVTLPNWGMTRNGYVYQHRTLERPISVIECGSWPTPCATDTADRGIHGEVHITKAGLPKHIGKSGEKSQMRLSQAVKLWPTPTVTGNYNRPALGRKSGTGLAIAAALWPTPTASLGTKGDQRGPSHAAEGTRGRDFDRGNISKEMANSCRVRCNQMEPPIAFRAQIETATGASANGGISGWRQGWPAEPGLGRVADGVAHRVDRLKAIGNGQVSGVAATAWRVLTD